MTGNNAARKVSAHVPVLRNKSDTRVDAQLRVAFRDMSSHSQCKNCQKQTHFFSFSAQYGTLVVCCHYHAISHIMCLYFPSMGCFLNSLFNTLLASTPCFSTVFLGIEFEHAKKTERENHPLTRPGLLLMMGPTASPWPTHCPLFCLLPALLCATPPPSHSQKSHVGRVSKIETWEGWMTRTLQAVGQSTAN